MPTGPEASYRDEDELTRDLLNKTAETSAEFSREEDERLEKAKREAVDKEAFDIDRLQEFYSLSSDALSYDVPISQEAIRELEVTYYLSYPELRTMEELARILKEQEATEH